MAFLNVSVIVPVYNAQKTVAIALDSLLCQTEKAFEIICVNDGSDDQTNSILQNYVRKDKRIRLITQTNQGAGAARNKGLSKARGEYIFFMDADDFVMPDFLSEAVAFARKNNAQITLFNAGVIDSQNHFVSKPTSSFLSKLPETFSFKTLPQKEKDDFYLETPLVPWNKLFKRQFLISHHLSFGTTQTSEDISFNLIALAQADKISYLPETYYYYRVDQKKSLSTKRPKDLMAACHAVQDADRHLLKKYPDLAYALKRYELFQYLTWLRRYIGVYPVSSFYQKVQERLIKAQQMDEKRLYRSFNKPYFDIVKCQSYEKTLYATAGFALSPSKGIIFRIKRKIYFLKQFILNQKQSWQFAKHIFSLEKKISTIAPLKDNAVVVVFAIDSAYIPLFSVALQSILEHLTKENFYDFVVLEKDIPENDKDILRKQISSYSNCSLRFWNMTSILNILGDSFLYESAHISKTAYYRLFIPFILKAFVQFLKESGSDDVCLVLTGPKRTNKEEVFQTIASFKKYQHKIIQTGFVDDADMPVLYSGALSFAYLSLSEGFGLPVLEAMQCKTPVLASHLTSLPEVGGEAALYVSGRDIKETAHALFRLYSEPFLRQSMAEKGIKQASFFSCEKTAGKIMGKYLSLAADKRKLEK